MESINLEMEDIFDDGRGDDDDDIGALPTTLPDLDDDEAPMAAGGDDEDNEGNEGEVDANIRRLRKGAAKKKVMRPQPKLDAERLKTERGLPLLLTTFKEVKFKGRGHEASDLKLMMSKLEHWAHRLYPKMTFDEFIDRMDKLGSKKPVQTTLTKIRLDMPILDSDFVQQFDEDDKEEGPAEASGSQGEVMDAEEAYEEMIRQEREQMSGQAGEGGGDAPSSPPGRPLSSQTAGTSNTHKDTPSTSAPTPKQVTPSKSVSDEQKERMERNRMKALEKRAARLGVPVSTLLPSASGASQSSQSAGSSSSPCKTAALTTSPHTLTPSKSQQAAGGLRASPYKGQATPKKSQDLPALSPKRSKGTPAKSQGSPSTSQESKSKDSMRKSKGGPYKSGTPKKSQSSPSTSDVPTDEMTKNLSGVGLGSSKEAENELMMETDELLTMLDDGDLEEQAPRKESEKSSRVVCSVPPENSEVLLGKGGSVSESEDVKGRLASADSEMDTESLGLHLTLDTTGTDEEEKLGLPVDCDKENSASNLDNTANNIVTNGKTVKENSFEPEPVFS